MFRCFFLSSLLSLLVISSMIQRRHSELTELNFFSITLVCPDLTCVQNLHSYQCLLPILTVSCFMKNVRHSACPPILGEERTKRSSVYFDYCSTSNHVWDALHIWEVLCLVQNPHRKIKYALRASENQKQNTVRVAPRSTWCACVALQQMQACSSMLTYAVVFCAF